MRCGACCSGAACGSGTGSGAGAGAGRAPAARARASGAGGACDSGAGAASGGACGSGAGASSGSGGACDSGAGAASGGACGSGARAQAAPATRAQARMRARSRIGLPALGLRDRAARGLRVLRAVRRLGLAGRLGLGATRPRHEDGALEAAHRDPQPACDLGHPPLDARQLQALRTRRAPLELALGDRGALGLVARAQACLEYAARGLDAVAVGRHRVQRALEHLDAVLGLGERAHELRDALERLVALGLDLSQRASAAARRSPARRARPTSAPNPRAPPRARARVRRCAPGRPRLLRARLLERLMLLRQRRGFSSSARAARSASSAACVSASLRAARGRMSSRASRVGRQRLGQGRGLGALLGQALLELVDPPASAARSRACSARSSSASRACARAARRAPRARCSAAPMPRRGLLRGGELDRQAGLEPSRSASARARTASVPVSTPSSSARRPSATPCASRIRRLTPRPRARGGVCSCARSASRRANAPRPLRQRRARVGLRSRLRRIGISSSGGAASPRRPSSRGPRELRRCARRRSPHGEWRCRHR